MVNFAEEVCVSLVPSKESASTNVRMALGMYGIWIAIFITWIVIKWLQIRWNVSSSGEKQPLISKFKETSYKVKNVGIYWSIKLLNQLIIVFTLMLSIAIASSHCLNGLNTLGIYIPICLAFVGADIVLTLEHGNIKKMRISYILPIFYLTSAVLTSISSFFNEFTTLYVLICSILSLIFSTIYFVQGTAVQIYTKKPPSQVYANLWSYLTFGWVYEILSVGNKRKLEMEDIPFLKETDQWDAVYNQFEIARNKNLAKGKGNLLWDIISMEKWNLAKHLGWGSISAVALYGGPWALKCITAFVTQEYNDETWDFSTGSSYISIWKVLVAVLVLLMGPVIQTVAFGQALSIGRLMSYRLRSALTGVVFRKSLRIDIASSASGDGEKSNLISVDVMRVSEFIAYCYNLATVPVQVVIVICLLFSLLGYTAVTGLVVMLLYMPLVRWVGSLAKKFNDELMKKKDVRISNINDILGGIRVIKLFAWEENFLSSVSNSRNKELSSLSKILNFNATSSVFWFGSQAVVSIITFVFHTRVFGQPLNIAQGLAAQSLFSLLSQPMNEVPMFINWGSRCWVSLMRIQKFLDESIETQAVEDKKPRTKKNESIGSVSVMNGSFKWDVSEEKETTTTLENIDLFIKPGSLTTVVGQVGSGKSSLLHALLREIHMLDGDVQLFGKVAYVPQRAWIQNATVRDNILFGLPMDQEKYERVIQCCCLGHDLKIFEDGDHTEIGERGVTLSGGQQQRISLARAVYSGADIYILDDCLSAVDAHVCKRIFEKCIIGILKKTTRILVTHQVSTCLPYSNHVVVLEDGKIILQGTPKEVTSSSKASDMIQKLNKSTSDDEEDIDSGEKDDCEDHSTSFTSTTTADKAKKLVKNEEMSVGAVDWRVYWTYIQALGGVTFIVIFLILLFGRGLIAYAQNWAMTHWLHLGVSSDIGLLIYGLLTIGELASFVFTSLYLSWASVRAANTLHHRLVDTIIHLPMQFFDSTPFGRILNRFTTDIENIDGQMVWGINGFFLCITQLLTALILCAYTSIWFLVVAIPGISFGMYVGIYYQRSAREIKRMESITRSPLYAHYSETVDGVVSIRAYNAGSRFIEENGSRMDYNNRAYYYLWMCNRWLNFRLNILAAYISFMVGLLVVIAADKISPAIAGLAIMYSMDLSGALTFVVRNYADVEMKMNSIERVREYMLLDREAPPVIEGARPASTWPENGRIEFRNIVLQYPNTDKPVLNGIQLTIESKESIGIVGRTGAGKSTMAMALFRLVEPISGYICIDGINTSTIGLRDLRSRISIIPQDPILFKGTLRKNLDPLDQYKDEELWKSLDRVNMKERISSESDKLETEVKENGSNFSVGERQLLCMSRALLRQSKILVMDEATANVDHETDGIIQQTLRHEFSNCTVLCIAHRIHTIIDFDKVLVLSNGSIAEYDTPKRLLNNGIEFKRLCEETGDYEHLVEMAKN